MFPQAEHTDIDQVYSGGGSKAGVSCPDNSGPFQSWPAPSCAMPVMRSDMQTASHLLTGSLRARLTAEQDVVSYAIR